MQRRKKPKTKKRAARRSAKRATPRKKIGTTKRPKPTPTKRASSRKPSFNKKTDSAYDPAWVAPVWSDDVLLGAHVSTAGGVDQAPPRALAIGASAMQVFTKMANRWAERDCQSAECEAFSAALGATRVRATMAHDSYLINLASPDETLRRRSIEAFVAELRRCEALGL